MNHSTQTELPPLTTRVAGLEIKPKASRFAAWAFFLVFLFSAGIAMVVAGSVPTSHYAVGCDAFGYLRQAQLFHTRGLLRGLDTHIRNEEAQFLIDTAKSLHVPAEQWSEMVAPHAHHYNSATGGVILQYPPGTGLLLSLLPSDRSTEIMTAIVVAAMTLAFALAAAGRSLGPVELAALMSILLVGDQLVIDTAGFSFSVIWTFGLIPLAALVALRIASRGIARLAAGIVLGLLSALLILTRIPNLFIIAGLGLFVLIQAWFEGENRLRRSLALLVATGVPFVLFGALPLLFANRLNAGGFLHSTYGRFDASPPSFDRQQISANMSYYFRDSYAWRTAILAVFVVLSSVIVVFVTKDPKSRRFVISVSSAVLCTFSLNLVYFAAHQISTPYYLAPGCLFVVCFGIFGLIEARALTSGESAKRSPPQIALAIVAIGVVLGMQVMLTPPVAIAPRLPQEVANPRSIVWADLTSGTILYYNGKYAAKLGFGSQCLQEKMIQAIYESGRPQYFIGDSATIYEIKARLSQVADFVPAGTYETPTPAAIYRLQSFKGKVGCK